MRRGFTLIELFVVIAIIAVLFALLLPVTGFFGGMTMSGTVSEKWTDVDNNHIINLTLPDGEIRQLTAWTSEYNSMQIGHYYEIDVYCGNNLVRAVRPLSSPVQPPVEVTPPN